MLDQYIKTARNGKEFMQQSEKYFVNMSNNIRTLHITECISCQYSRYAAQFITFSSMEDVELFEKNHTQDTPFRRCRNCFR